MQLISERTTLYTLKVLVAKAIFDELTDQFEQLGALSSRSDFQEYYYNVLGYYFVEDDEGDDVLNLFIDRLDDIEEAEIPLINVTVDGQENNENGTVSHVNTDYSFDIEVCDKKTGDATATDKVEFMTGIIRNILATTRFSGLQHQRVTSRRFNTRGFDDASNVTSASVIFYVKYFEDVFIKNNTVDLEMNVTDFRGKWQLKTDNLGE